VRSVERKKISRRQRVSDGPATGPNRCWSADFVSDKLTDGRTYRILTVIDQFTTDRGGKFALVRLPCVKSRRKFLAKSKDWLRKHRHGGARESATATCTDAARLLPVFRVTPLPSKAQWSTDRSNASVGPYPAAEESAASRTGLIF
jgi:hypothetical protein